METILLSRQPIFRGDMDIIGYELLFRDCAINCAIFSDGDRATAQTILNACSEIGLEQVVGPYPAFINFSRNFLLSDYCEALPPQRLVLEILEMVEPDAQVLNRLKELRRKGYRIALDDFVYTDSSAALLDLADFVKVDIMATSGEYIERMMPVLKGCKAKLIAEKVETRDQLSFCKRAGFDYFQGYFFCRPQMLSSGRTPPNRMSAVQLIATLNDPDTHIRELERIICQDVALSYKLLRYVNSAICGLPRAVESIGHAAMLVGHKKLRIWASLILFSRLDNKPSDLIITGLVRARMCEGIAETLNTDKVDHFFLTGLFSVLDALLDRPVKEAVRSLPLPQDIVAALLDQKGRMGSLLEAVIAYERRDWDKARFECVDVESMRRRYVEAMTLVLNTFKILEEQQTSVGISN